MLTISWKSSTKRSKSPQNLDMKMKTRRRRCLRLKTKDLESKSTTQTRIAITNRRITAKQSFRKMTHNIARINTKTNNRTTGEVKNSKTFSLIKIRRKISTLRRTNARKETIVIVDTLTRLTSSRLARQDKNIKRSPKVSTTRHKMISKLTSSTTTQTQTLSFRNSSNTMASNISPTSLNLPSTTKTTMVVIKPHSSILTILQTISNKIFHSIHSAKVLRRISMRLLHKIPKSLYS